MTLLQNHCQLRNPLRQAATIDRIRLSLAERAVQIPSSLAAMVVQSHQEWAVEVDQIHYWESELAAQSPQQQVERADQIRFEQSHQVRLACQRPKSLAVMIDRTWMQAARVGQSPPLAL